MLAHTDNYKNTTEFCRVFVAQTYFQSFSIAINIGIIGLFTYIAQSMCKTPLQAFFRRLMVQGIITTEQHA